MRELTKAVATKDPSDIVTHHNKVDFLPHHVSVSHTHYVLCLLPLTAVSWLHAYLRADMLELDVALCSHTPNMLAGSLPGAQSHSRCIGTKFKRI